MSAREKTTVHLDAPVHGALRMKAAGTGQIVSDLVNSSVAMESGMQTIFPLLRYADARAAIRSLCACFGFVELFSVPESGPFVRHAQLRLGSSVIMLGSVRPDDGMASPRPLGAATQGLCVYVEDLDAHFERARSAGAEILSPPTKTDFGAREYYARDIEGHPWTFGTYLPVLPDRAAGSTEHPATLSPQTRSAVDTCVEYWLHDLRLDAPELVYQEAAEKCRLLTEAISNGKPLAESPARDLLKIASFYVDLLTYQRVPPHMEPRLPLLELPDRLQTAAAIVEGLEPLLRGTAVGMGELHSAVERAKRLRFRWSYGEPLDYDVLRVERALLQGSAIRIPVARSISVPFGPTSWNESQGPARPGRIFVRIGQAAPATALLLIEQDRPHVALSMAVFALFGDEKRLLLEIRDEVLWYCQDLDRAFGAVELKGSHFVLRAKPTWSRVEIADLDSPLGVYLQIPLPPTAERS